MRGANSPQLNELYKLNKVFLLKAESLKQKEEE
jgi:hypothetical protein